MKILILMIAMLLTACVTTTAEKSEAAARKAAETNTALGRSYMDRGQYEIALEKLKRAVANDRSYAPAHTLLGVLYETIGETELAGKEYQLAVKYDPKDGDVNNNYGAYLCARGEPGKAERYFLTAVDDPFYETPAIAMANAGSCALQRGDLDNAEAFLRQSLEYDSRLGSALLPMAEVSYRQGEYLRARAFLQRFETLGVMDEKSLSLGYEIETRLGDQESAEKYRAELQQRYPNSARAGSPARQE